MLVRTEAFRHASAAGSFHPSQVAGLAAHFSPASGKTTDANGVQQWDDLSGNANHLTAPTSTDAPTADALVNGQDAISFVHANEDRMALPSSLNTNNTAALFAVLTADDPEVVQRWYFGTGGTAASNNGWLLRTSGGNWQLVFADGTNTDFLDGIASAAAGVPQIIGMAWDGTTWRLDIGANGVAGTFSTVGTDRGTDTCFVGTADDRSDLNAGMDLGHLLVFGQRPSDADFDAIMQWLSDQSGVPL